MSSRVKQVNVDLLTALKNMTYLDKKSLFKYFNIWDDQIDEMILGDTYSYSTNNACFIEFDLGEGMALSMGYVSHPHAIIRLHMVNMLLDAGNGNMEQNLKIFDVRDVVASVMPKSNISFCSTLMCCEDKADFKHGNIYKYVIGFKTNFIDNKSSIFDVDASGAQYGYLENPELNLNVYGVWWSGESYTSNLNVVSYRDNLYLCKIDNEDEVFNPDNWILVSPWIASVKYLVNSYVAFNNNIYKCNAENNDSVFDPVKWDLIV